MHSKRRWNPCLKTNTAAGCGAGDVEAAGVCPVGIVLNVDDTRKLEQISGSRNGQERRMGVMFPGTPLKFGYYNSVGTMIPSPPLDNRGAAIRAEFAPRNWCRDGRLNHGRQHRCDLAIPIAAQRLRPGYLQQGLNRQIADIASFVDGWDRDFFALLAYGPRSMCAERDTIAGLRKWTGTSSMAGLSFRAVACPVTRRW